MAFTHGKNTYISVDGNDISAYCNTSSLERSSDSHDVTTYGATAHAFGDDGLTNATFSCGGTYDSTTSGPHDVLAPLVAGAKVTLIRRPEGTGSGLPQESVSIKITKYTETSPVADYVSWALDAQCSGAITDTNQA